MNVELFTDGFAQGAIISAVAFTIGWFNGKRYGLQKAIESAASCGGSVVIEAKRKEKHYRCPSCGQEFDYAPEPNSRIFYSCNRCGMVEPQEISAPVENKKFVPLEKKLVCEYCGDPIEVKKTIRGIVAYVCKKHGWVKGVEV